MREDEEHLPEEEHHIARALSDLDELPSTQKLALMRDYLIAATFKDCSFIVTFQQEDLKKRSQLRIIDTDMKQIGKIPVHYELDQKILQCSKNIV